MRNPCFFARLRLFGWNVRFTHCLLGAADPGMPPTKGDAIHVNPASPLARMMSLGDCHAQDKTADRCRPAPRA